MKNRLILSFLTASILLSCSDDDKPSVSASLIGKWEATSEVVTNCTDVSENHNLTCGGYAFCQTFEFKSDETYTRSNTQTKAQLGQGTYTVSGSQVLVDYGNSAYFLYDVQINGTTLTLTETERRAPCVVTITYRKVN